MSRIVIIGGGVAGLSAGIYARMNGFDAEIYEMNALPGGNLCAWERSGYRIDNCIHWLTGTNPASSGYEMWRDLGVLGEGIEVIQNETLYTCEYGGMRLSLSCGLERLRRDMLAVSPADRRETERLIRAVKDMQGIGGIGGASHDRKYGLLRAAAALPRLARYLRMTTGDLAARFCHPLCRSFLCDMLTADFGAIALLEVFSCFTGRNGGLPRGGSAAAARRMAERFASLGGRLYLNKRAVSLERSGERIASALFSDGGSAQGEEFIVTADPASVFGGMVDLPMPRALGKMYSDRRLRRFSAVHCAFACDAERPPFKGDHLTKPGEVLRGELGCETVVLREFSHEPDFAPPGKSVIQAMAFIGEAEAKKYISLRSDTASYARKKRRIAELITGEIIRLFPVLDGKLELLDVWTPATYNRYTASDAGSFMSFAFSSGYLPVTAKCRVDGAENLYLAGQWLQAPGGLPIAARTGRDAVLEIMGK